MKCKTMPATTALTTAPMMAIAYALMMATAYSPVGAQELEREFIDPAGVFTQVVTVADRGVKTIYVSGQVGQGADLAAHVESAFQGVVRRLESAGASTSDVVKIRIFVKDFDEEYCLTDDIRDIYVDIPLRLTKEQLPEDRWIKSVEYRNGPAVHHIVGGVGGLVPGAEPRVYEDGYGRLLRAGPREINFNMHYNKTPGPGTAVCSNIKVGITFKEPGEVIKYVTGGNGLFIRPIVIPPGASSYSASREYTFEEDVELLRFMPHMHLRGKAALYEVTYPDGRHETLLHVPNYAFNWQHSYRFADPPFIPAGSVLRFTLWWDNSENNPANPDPTAEVRWGRPTHAEMSQGYMSFRRLEERHIVVGEAIPADLVIADSDQVEESQPTRRGRANR